jgi:hypothetical protein
MQIAFNALFVVDASSKAANNAWRNNLKQSSTFILVVTA